MMDWTDRHCRFLHRLATRRALLYSEMLTADAVVFGDRDRLLAFSPEERPVALQLGGSEPRRLAEAAAIGAAHGYCEINLNVGCPSSRVRDGCFGATLMARPELVAASVRAMGEAVDVPVTVKCRIGIDNRDSERDLHRFVEAIAGAGCGRVIVHARKALLSGLSPKENRGIPPLDYDRVYRLKETFSDLEIIINGGITSLEEARVHLERVDGVMVGRAAYHRPYLLAGVDATIFGDERPGPSLDEIVQEMISYARRETARGVRLHCITRHMLGLYRGMAGARRFRRLLSEMARAPDAGAEVIAAACRAVGAVRSSDDGRPATERSTQHAPAN